MIRNAVRAVIFRPHFAGGFPAGRIANERESAGLAHLRLGARVHLRDVLAARWARDDHAPPGPSSRKRSRRILRRK